jgi:hypothetical protein
LGEGVVGIETAEAKRDSDDKDANDLVNRF